MRFLYSGFFRSHAEFFTQSLLLLLLFVRGHPIHGDAAAAPCCAGAPRECGGACCGCRSIARTQKLPAPQANTRELGLSEPEQQRILLRFLPIIQAIDRSVL